MLRKGEILEDNAPWVNFVEPGEVFKFLRKNHVCYQIDMESIPPLNLIAELMHIASLMNKNSKSRSYRAISDLTSLIVAASAGSAEKMLEELVVRDQLQTLDTDLSRLFNDSNYPNSL